MLQKSSVIPAPVRGAAPRTPTAGRCPGVTTLGSVSVRPRRDSETTHASRPRDVTHIARRVRRHAIAAPGRSIIHRPKGIGRDQAGSDRATDVGANADMSNLGPPVGAAQATPKNDRIWWHPNRAVSSGRRGMPRWHLPRRRPRPGSDLRTAICRASNRSTALTSLVFLVDDKVNRCLGNQRFGKLWQAESARTGNRKTRK